MLPDQVVKSIAAPNGLIEQMMGIEYFQQFTGCSEGAVCQRSGSVCINVGARLQPQPSKELLL